MVKKAKNKAKKVAIFNGKGGCGKSTVAVHESGVIASRGQKGLIIDVDKQRNTTDTLLMENEDRGTKTILDFMQGNADVREVVKRAYFRSRGNANPKYYGIDVLPSHNDLQDESLLKNVDIKDSLNEFIEEEGYDWVLIDMPPSNKTLNEICFTQIAEHVIVPFSSDVYSVNGYGDLMDTISEARTINENLNILGIFLSRYMENCGVDRFIKEQLKQFGDMFIDIQIPLRADAREAIMFGRPMSFYKPTSTTTVAYESLFDEMIRRINKYK